MRNKLLAVALFLMATLSVLPAGYAESGISDGLILIPGGSFLMGSPETENWRIEDETQHQVTQSGFYMSPYEVTQAEYERLMGTNPSSFHGENLPVESVSWLDAVRGFQAAIAEAGLGSPDIMADGEIHRFDTPEDKKGAKTGWYLLYPDNIAAGAFGSWREGETRTWSARHQFEMTAEEQEAVRRRMESARRLRERARMMEADEAALEAERIWRESAPADPDHPYLVRKQVSPFMLRQEGDALIVPMIDAEGRIRGVQRIFPDGTKRYLSGVAKNGLYAWLEGDASVVYVCEGYATGASLHMATGNAVVVAFDSGNLQHVAPLVKNGFPQAQVILAADNDAFTRRQDGAPWNTGLEAASKAAKALGLTVVWPEFRDLSSRPTDFNDLHVLEGLQEVRAQAAPIESGPRISAWTADVFDGEPEPRKWLVKDMIPLGCPCLLAAAGGTGKGILLLDLALSVASSAWRAEGVINGWGTTWKLMAAPSCSLPRTTRIPSMNG